MEEELRNFLQFVFTNYDKERLYEVDSLIAQHKDVGDLLHVTKLFFFFLASSPEFMLLLFLS